MSNKVTFQLDTAAAGRIILQGFAAPIVELSGKAIAQRAGSMGASMSGNPPGFDVTTRVGVIRRGSRAIARVTATDAGDAHQNYIARQALVKAKDAGRLR